MSHQSDLQELMSAYHQATQQHLGSEPDSKWQPAPSKSGGYWRAVWRAQRRAPLPTHRSWKLPLLIVCCVLALVGSLYGLYQLELRTHVPFPNEGGGGTPPAIHWQGR
jgi:hypothetical protein